jgi:hypothetical protein
MRFSKCLLLHHLESIDCLGRQPCPRCHAGRWQTLGTAEDWQAFGLWECTAGCGFACMIRYDGEATAGCRLNNGRRTSTRVARIVRGQS